MQDNKPYILQTFFKAVLELKAHPEAKDCVEFVNDFLDNISNENILKGCSISWDDTNKGLMLLWDDILPKYMFKADMLVCNNYYHYNFILKDRDGNYLGSDGIYEEIKDFEGHNWYTGECGVHKDKPFWKDIVSHLEKVYQ